jgi:hypothetical protein
MDMQFNENAKTRKLRLTYGKPKNRKAYENETVAILLSIFFQVKMADYTGDERK